MSSWLRSPTVDLAVGAVALVLGIADVLAHDALEGPLAVHLAIVAVVSAAYAIRRRRPLLAALAFVITMGVSAAAFTSPAELVIAFAGLLLITYALGAHAESRSAVLGLAAIVALVVVVEVSSEDADALFPSVMCVAAFLAGRSVRSRTALTAELHEAALLAEEARESEAALAMAAERRRIAREMHDVVAHSISVMVVQAGGARRILEREPERAVAAAAQIEETGRAALEEMRRLLGVLRPGEDRGVLEPQPRLDGLDALLDRARSAGLPVEMVVEGESQPLPAGLDLAAYRIVQEALTNALKHAGKAPTRVALRWTAGALDIEVVNAPAREAHGLPGTGHGLPGMHERVRLYGGDLYAGPRDGGGFEVRAHLPLVLEEVPA